jgi:hypothetical protein
MEDYMIFIALGIGSLLVAVIAAMRIRYRWLLKKKNDGICRQIFEQKRLEEELERTRIEKETLKEVLKIKSDDHQQASGAEDWNCNEKEFTLLVKARKI